MEMDIGISKEVREAIAQGLSRVLADTYALYLKTHAYHWNVTGPLFSSLHLLFEAEYNELHDAADTIAERIRALGHFAPGSYAVFARLTSIPEDNGSVPAALSMVRNLALGHETLGRTLRAAFGVAEAGGDQATMDMLIGRMEASDKAAWMLRSHLESPGSEALPES
jgi:starvation-inducible DNA-binding protein